MGEHLLRRSALLLNIKSIYSPESNDSGECFYVERIGHLADLFVQLNPPRGVLGHISKVLSLERASEAERLLSN